MEAVFRAPTKFAHLTVIYPDYAPVGEGIELRCNGKGKRVCVGTCKDTYVFSGGQHSNLLVLDNPSEILRVRERIKNNPEFIEAFCDAEAKALGGGSGEPVEGRDHSKHIEELKRKYGGDEEPEYSERDRSLISKIKQ